MRKLKLKTLKFIITILLATSVTMSCLNISALAASADSPTRNATVYGITYNYYSSVHNNSTSTWGYGHVYADDNVPTGYFGINARLYNSSGTLIKSSGMQYNGSSVNSKSLNSGSTTTKGTYYSQCQVSFYNGNGYHSYLSYSSPYVQRSLAPMSLEKSYEVNENGLTYGSGLYAESLEDSLDLIRAIGINGVEGYVYSKEINLELNTLDKVIDYINSGQQDYSVPVYAEDGTTIVDTFEVVTEDSSKKDRKSLK